MLLHSLEFNNFMMFHGKHRMEFPCEKNVDKPFTLILAPTNSGKTTTIRALRFLLYGNLDGKPLGRPDKLISHREKLGCNKGDKVEAWVHAKIKFGPDADQTITFRRRIHSTRTGAGIDGFDPGTIHLEELQLQGGGAGNIWKGNASKIEALIRTLAPNLLFNLFVFAGEPGEGRIDPTATDAKLIDDLHRIFRIDAWKDTRRTVTQMLDSLQNIGRTNNQAELKVATAWQLVLRQQALHTEAVQKIADLKEEIPGLEERTLGLATKIASLAPLTEKAELLQKEVLKLESLIHDAEQEISRTKESLKQCFSSISRTIWIEPAVAEVIKWIPKHIVEKPEIPERIVRWLLDAKKNTSQQCICGTKLCPDGKAHEALSSLLRDKDRASSSEALQFVLKNSQELSGAPHISRIDKISSHLQFLDQTATSKEDSQKLIVPKRRELEQLQSSEAKDALLELTRVREALRTKNRELGAIENSLDGMKHRIQAAKDDHRRCKTALPKNQQAELARNEERARILQSLLDLVNLTEQRLKHYLVEGMQQRLTSNYDSAATDGSHAKVSGALTPTIQRNGVTMTAVGGGQKLMLELAYVVALADVYREICNSFEDSDIALPSAGDVSIFADAAFAHSADQFNEQIVKFLSRSSAKQVCLLMHKAQWNNVKQWLEPKVGRCYGFRLNSALDLSHSEEYKASVKDHHLDLFTKIAANEEPFTKIEHIF